MLHCITLLDNHSIHYTLHSLRYKIITLFIHYSISSIIYFHFTSYHMNLNSDASFTDLYQSLLIYINNLYSHQFKESSSGMKVYQLVFDICNTFPIEYTIKLQTIIHSNLVSLSKLVVQRIAQSESIIQCYNLEFKHFTTCSHNLNIIWYSIIIMFVSLINHSGFLNKRLNRMKKHQTIVNSRLRIGRDAIYNVYRSV